MRVHLATWHGEPAEQIEARVRRLPGVEQARANPLTGNVLVRFDPRKTTSDALLEALGRLEKHLAAGRGHPSVGAFGARVLRVGVRGMMGHALVDTLLCTVAFAEPFGLPLATLAKWHLGLDLLVWGAALTPLLEEESAAAGPDGLAAPAPGP